MFCTLQKPYIKSGETIIVARNLQSHQFDKLFLYGPAFSSRPIKLKVTVKHFLAVGKAPQVRSVNALGIQVFHQRLNLGR
jgi:hypothetical protein